MLTLSIIVDHLQNTAGDIALSFNNELIYTLIRDAGIRSGALTTLSVLSTFPTMLRGR